MTYPALPPPAKFRAMVRPGAPQWLRYVVAPGVSAASQLLVVVSVFVLIGLFIGAGVLASVIPLLGVPLAALILGGTGLAVRKLRPEVLTPTLPVRLAGQAIEGKPLELLEDIDQRFAYAERMIAEVPTGLEWEEIEADVRVMLWEAAGHAAKATALTKEVYELRYAAKGTPQAALLAAVKQRRGDQLEMMRRTQWEAETLARSAGNAAAAARFALLRTGSLAALEVAAPSAQAILARDALATARTRLELLAEVWSTLDESNSVLAERIDHEASTERRRRAR